MLYSQSRSGEVLAYSTTSVWSSFTHSRNCLLDHNYYKPFLAGSLAAKVSVWDGLLIPVFIHIMFSFCRDGTFFCALLFVTLFGKEVIKR